MHQLSGFAPRRRLSVLVLIGACVALMGTAGGARAATVSPSGTRVVEISPASIPGLIAAWSGNRHIAGHRLTPREAILLAARSPRIASYWRAHPALAPAALPYRSGNDAMWEISWIQGTQPQIFAEFDERGDRVIVTWTGTQAEWAMARGYAWYSGSDLGKWFVWVPLCLLFLLPFLDRKRPFRLLHFDLLVLLGFSVSFFAFESGDVSASVPLVYPVLAYLLGRMLWIGFRPSVHRERLVPHLRASWLIAGIVLLVLGRVALNLTDSTVLDVGSAGAAGAHLLLHGKSLYDGALGRIIVGGDTYGPVNYLAYAPFAALFPHDQVGVDPTVYAHHPSAQVAAICFDLLALGGLILLGRRIRPGSAGTLLGLALGYAWASFPFTALTLQENTNDSLVAALIILTLVLLYSPARRGVLLALGALAKFVPLILVPLIATGTGPRRTRSWATFALAFALTAAAILLPFAVPDGFRTFYHDTIGSQLHRTSPFSIWGQHASLHLLRLGAEAGTVMLAIALAFVPRQRSSGQVAALAAALVIAVEICVSYWYYSYVVWFAPLVFAALFASYSTSSEPTAVTLDELPVRELTALERIPEPVS